MAISPSTTTAAIEALLKWHNNNSNTQTTSLNADDDFIYLILTLKSIPQKGNGINGIRTKPNKIPLPNPLFQSPEACLIIDDRPNSNLTSKLAKEKIATENIPVSKVIKLSKLKSSYKPFEAKRKLCDSFDMFFADKRVIPFLPKLLGKHFFKKKKLPLDVDLGHKNWKEQIERGYSSGLLYFSSGTCSVVRVANVGMEKSEIAENVDAAIKGVVGCVSKKLSGVRSLHLKFSGSVALPLYQSLPDIKLRIAGVDEKGDEDVEDVMEIDDVGGKKDKKKKAKKSRIHDMNHDVSEMIVDDDDSGGDDMEETKPVKEIAKEEDGSGKKKRKGNAVDGKKKAKKGKVKEVSFDDEVEEIENEEPVSDEVVDVKPAKKSVKEKKNETKPSEKKVKKKGEKKTSGDSGKKEKKKVRSVTRA